MSDQLRLLAHLSRFMEANGVSLDQLGPGRVDEFLTVRRQAGYTLWLSRKALVPLLNYLEGIGARPVTVEVPVPRPCDVIMGRYRSYLLIQRALGQESAAAYLRVGRSFLGTRPQVGVLGLSELSAVDVVSFVREECAARSVKSAQFVVTALRSLLRFLYLEGTITMALADAVPSVAGWKLATLPKAMSTGQVAALLDSCDRRTTVGRRDFAVLTVLVRLWLRSGEVAALCLDDIDWRAGEVVVRGKGPKQARLPLPADVGEALAAWLRRGRPRCADRAVFTRVHAPHRRLSPSGVLRSWLPPVSAPVSLVGPTPPEAHGCHPDAGRRGQLARGGPGAAPFAAAHHGHLRKSGPQPARRLGQALAHGISVLPR